MNRIILKGALFCCCILWFTNSAIGQISSPFNSNAEGWTTPNDADGTIAYSATGGNPGGHVFGTPFFFNVGATTIYVPFNFVAPGTYTGNRSSFYNGTLRYQVQQSTTGAPNQYAEVTIANSLGIVLYYFPATSNQPPAPPSWGTYSVVLNNVLGFWKTTNSPTGPLATELQVQNILTDLNSLQIRGLYRDANTTNRLDNVSFSPPIIITTQPTSTTVCDGIIASFTTAATNNAAITYQWQRETSPSVWTDLTNVGGYSGVTTANFSVNTTGTFGAGNYRCRISGAAVVDALTSVVTLTINPLPSAAITTGSVVCGDAAVTLSASGGAAGQYRWYTVASGGIAIAGQTNSTYTTPVLTSTTTYYVSINNGTCESARTLVVATINTIPTAPTTTDNAACGSSAIALSAAGGAAGQYRWYTTASGGIAITGEVNSTYITPIMSSTTTYYVSINNGFCESNRTAVTATINSIPTAPTSTDGSSCVPAAITISAAGGANGDYVWYGVPTGGTPIAGEVNSTYTTPLISSTTSYYVAITNGICESARTPVVATIGGAICTNSPPEITTSTTSTTISGIAAIDLNSLINDADGNLDPTSIRIVVPPLSGASATISNGILSISYLGVSFAGEDKITIEACDVFNACTQKQFTINVEGDVIVYNGISPNGDLLNNRWIIRNIESLPDTKENIVTIYNRWGDLIFETENYDNDSNVFEGISIDGKEITSGVYFYKIEFKNSTRKTLTGYLTVRK